MKPYHVAGLSILGTLLVGWIALKTVYEPYMTREVIGLTIREGRKIEALNNIGRLEAYDTLSDFLRKGCAQESKQFVELQQSLLLASIAYDMREDREVSNEVLSKSSAIAERARAETRNSNPARAVPRCQ